MSEPDKDKDSSKSDFNRAGMYLYGVISGVTFSIAAGIFCAGAALKGGEHSVLWGAGAGLFALAIAGGIYETARLLKNMNSSGGNPPPGNNDHQPKP